VTERTAGVGEDSKTGGLGLGIVGTPSQLLVQS